MLSKILLYFLGLVILRILKQMPSINFCLSHSLASTSIYLSLNPYRSFWSFPLLPPQTHTHRHRHTHTQTHTHSHTDTHRHTDTHTDTYTHRERHTQTHRHTDTQTHTDSHRHTHTETHTREGLYLQVCCHSGV